MFRSILLFFRSGLEALVKDSAKAVVAFVLLSIIALVLYLFFGGVPDGATSKSGDLTFISFLSWVGTGLVAFGRYLFSYFSLHPLGTLFYVFILSVVGVLSYFGFRFGRRFVLAFRESAQLRDLVQRLGVFGFSPTALPEAEIGNWDRLTSEISNPANRVLYILGATGWETFGYRNSPLYETLGKFNGHIRIILMDPASKYLSPRAASIGFSEAGYKNHIKKSIKRLSDLHKKGRFIELKLYDSPPNWKMILTAQFGWIQHYWRELHVADTAVYLLYATDDERGLYHAFYDDFDRIWCLAKKCDL